MSKRDYERAATLIREWPTPDAPVLIEAFAVFFSVAPGFDEARFRRACVVGANVRARARRAS